MLFSSTAMNWGFKHYTPKFEAPHKSPTSGTTVISFPEINLISGFRWQPLFWRFPPKRRWPGRQPWPAHAVLTSRPRSDWLLIQSTQRHWLKRHKRVWIKGGLIDADVGVTRAVRERLSCRVIFHLELSGRLLMFHSKEKLYIPDEEMTEKFQLELLCDSNPDITWWFTFSSPAVLRGMLAR